MDWESILTRECGEEFTQMVVDRLKVIGKEAKEAAELHVKSDDQRRQYKSQESPLCVEDHQYLYRPGVSHEEALTQLLLNTIEEPVITELPELPAAKNSKDFKPAQPQFFTLPPLDSSAVRRLHLAFCTSKGKEICDNAREMRLPWGKHIYMNASVLDGTGTLVTDFEAQIEISLVHEDDWTPVNQCSKCASDLLSLVCTSNSKEVFVVQALEGDGLDKRAGRRGAWAGGKQTPNGLIHVSGFELSKGSAFIHVRVVEESEHVVSSTSHTGDFCLRVTLVHQYDEFPRAKRCVKPRPTPAGGKLPPVVAAKPTTPPEKETPQEVVEMTSWSDFQPDVQEEEAEEEEGESVHYKDRKFVFETITPNFRVCFAGAASNSLPPAPPRTYPKQQWSKQFVDVPQQLMDLKGSILDLKLAEAGSKDDLYHWLQNLRVDNKLIDQVMRSSLPNPQEMLNLSPQELRMQCGIRDERIARLLVSSAPLNFTEWRNAAFGYLDAQQRKEKVEQLKAAEVKAKLETKKAQAQLIARLTKDSKESASKKKAAKNESDAFRRNNRKSVTPQPQRGRPSLTPSSPLPSDSPSARGRTSLTPSSPLPTDLPSGRTHCPSLTPQNIVVDQLASPDEPSFASRAKQKTPSNIAVEDNDA